MEILRKKSKIILTEKEQRLILPVKWEKNNHNPNNENDYCVEKLFSKFNFEVNDYTLEQLKNVIENNIYRIQAANRYLIVNQEFLEKLQEFYVKDKELQDLQAENDRQGISLENPMEMTT